MAAATTLGAITPAHTGITVSDMDRAIRFFRDVLGFPVSHPHEFRGDRFEKLTGVPGAEIRVARVLAPGHTIELLQYLNAPARIAPDLLQTDAGATHLAFRVEDIDAVVARVREAGVLPIGPVQVIADGPRVGMKAVYTRDADGIVLEFLEITHRDGEGAPDAPPPNA